MLQVTIPNWRIYCNYVFLGSQESMIREIFEKKKSPFYHFGIVLTLEKISQDIFGGYLSTRSATVDGIFDPCGTITGKYHLQQPETPG